MWRELVLLIRRNYLNFFMGRVSRVEELRAGSSLKKCMTYLGQDGDEEVEVIAKFLVFFTAFASRRHPANTDRSPKLYGELAKCYDIT